jgi:hypothetical protein
MVRLTLATLTILIALATPVAAQNNGEVRHSGKIVEISEAGRTIVLEEMLAWEGPDKPGIVNRSITVTPQTSIQLVERTGEWGTARTSLPGWDSERIGARELREGDFVTVTTAAATRSRAIALQVIRPGE